MSPMVAGVVEEVAFRGYMQRHLERIGPTFAILVTSVAFTLAHATHGLSYLLAVAPGFVLASVVYGHLALKSKSIVPGISLHVAGDLAFAYFALLGGESGRLFASSPNRSAHDTRRRDDPACDDSSLATEARSCIRSMTTVGEQELEIRLGDGGGRRGGRASAPALSGGTGEDAIGGEPTRAQRSAGCRASPRAR